MCEPFMLARTGLSVVEHQLRTVENYVQLRDRAPDLPFAPVLQGWCRDDYHRCIEMYQQAGADLTAEPLVGVGSVCRRQATGEIEAIVHSLASLGLRLHGFGVKAGGLVRYADCLESADSLAWSSRRGGRRRRVRFRRLAGPAAEAEEPAANSSGGQAQRHRDAPVTVAGRLCQEGRADDVDEIEAAEQRGRRHQDVGRPARAAHHVSHE